VKSKVKSRDPSRAQTELMRPRQPQRNIRLAQRQIERLLRPNQFDAQCWVRRSERGKMP
jgi:hypothetical protein